MKRILRLGRIVLIPTYLASYAAWSKSKKQAKSNGHGAKLQRGCDDHRVNMADNQQLEDVGSDDIFVYTGGDQQVPRDVRRVRIAENVGTILAETFRECFQLIEVEGHNKIKKIKKFAFDECISLRRLTNMGGVIEIENDAFYGCTVLSALDIIFGKLEIIGRRAFANCESLRSINLPSIRTIGGAAFCDCTSLTDAVFGEDLEFLGFAFRDCTSLRRIAIPLKDEISVGNRAFTLCESLVRVDPLIGGIHKTISSLYMESWRDEMNEEIDRINQTLTDTRSAEKGAAINRWIESVLRRMEHYKEEHRMLVKEAMTLLELALWKAKLHYEEGRKCEAEEKMSQKAKIGKESTRNEHRVTCGANIVIKNVLPFLALE